jgi:hypothetical protein
MRTFERGEPKCVINSPRRWVLREALVLRSRAPRCERGVRERLGDHVVTLRSETRPFDLPWVVLDASLATEVWGWKPLRRTGSISKRSSGMRSSLPVAGPVQTVF